MQTIIITAHINKVKTEEEIDTDIICEQVSGILDGLRLHYDFIEVEVDE